MKYLSLAIALLGFLACACATKGKKVFCYYSSSSQYRSYPGGLKPNRIDASLCSHIIFAFVDVKDNQFRSINWNDEGPNGLYQQTVNLKRRNSSLKVLLAVGGWVADYQPFEAAMVDSHAMTQFATNAVTYLRRHGFDGLDMDWEFPGTRGSPPEDREKFTVFMRIIQIAFANDARKSDKEKLILTLAAAVGLDYIDVSYEPYLIHRYVDYMLLMTYNFHGSWENNTGHHSTLLPSQYDEGVDRYLCQAWAVNYWLSRGVPKEKMILGLATYGMSFTLEDATNNGLNASSLGGGQAGRISRQLGVLAYYEICQHVKARRWKSVWVDHIQAPYATGGDQWVGYDTPRSLRIKVAALVKHYDLAGAFVWSIDLDDIHGVCGEGRFPLLHAINKALANPGVQPITRPDHVYPSSFCKSVGQGYYADKETCHRYSFCSQALGGYVEYFSECPPGNKADVANQRCIEEFECL